MGYDPVKIEVGTNSIRYVGNIRGLDELGHYMFAISLDGSNENFGEFSKAFKADRTHYDVEIRSVGYSLDDQAPSKDRQCRFTATQEVEIRKLIAALIDRDRLGHNNLLGTFANNFTGEIIYDEGWLHFAP